MNIVGIEIIKPDSAGVVAVLPGQKVQLTYGDVLRIGASFDYNGPAGVATLYGAIGIRGFGFDEKVHGEADITLPSSPGGFTPCQAAVNITITSDINPGTDYDIYVKILDHLDAGLPEVDNVIDIVGVPPSYQLLEHTVYPYAYVYDGKDEVSEFTFRTDPFSPSAWIAGKLAAEVEKQVKQAGGRIMDLKVYVDKTPLLWSDWRLEVTTTPAPSATAGQGIGSLGVWWLGIAIIAALAIILIIVITWAAKTIVSSFTHQALSEEIKKTWSRESLISVIGDFEAKLERTPTPTADLEKKSDQELRDYCDSLAKEIVPPAGVGLGLAIAGVGLAAVGILVALGLSARGK